MTPCGDRETVSFQFTGFVVRGARRIIRCRREYRLHVNFTSMRCQTSKSVLDCSRHFIIHTINSL